LGSSNEIEKIESELNLTLPDSYKNFLLNKGNDIAFGLPILGLPATYDFSTSLGATSFLRMSRPDLNNYLVIRIYDDRVLCLDLPNGNLADSPLVEINLNSSDAPKKLRITFGQYIKNSDISKREVKKGIGRLRDIIELNKSYGRVYDHTDNIVPFKARHWRVHRCCVHDLVVGLTAFRYNESFNGIEVDTFLSTEHPDYEQGHGTKALMALILSDAYKNGTSMEVRFKNKSIPKNLLLLINSYDIKLQKEDGIITHNESVNIFSSLLGIQNETKDRIRLLEEIKEGTLQGVCFLINSRVWTTEEINWLILNASRVKAIIFGRDTPEIRFNYLESLSLGRGALALSKFKEKIQNSSLDEINEVDISIQGEFFLMKRLKPCSIDWLYNGKEIHMEEGETLVILSRPRSKWTNIAEQINDDIEKISKEKGKKIILYCNNVLDNPIFLEKQEELNEHYESIAKSIKLYREFLFQRRELDELHGMESRDLDSLESEIKLKAQSFHILDWNFLILPFSSEDLDEEVILKMKKARRYRT